ncbi:Milk fat globule-EGF factor 8 protein a [Desmophyllum pertusum]|uniref:Milk fat globule-EGF factor 8 protein a n=1 Tax=Desmophyllum pertusum TaxID=174260 RepID=A0A9W9YJC6_9CNID|nr:Milk fat globule-EGF factor 8 protein a [Desmophyllum pertusum]
MKAIQIFLALLCLLCNFGVKGNPCELDDYKDLNQSGRSVNYNGGTNKCDYEDLQGTWDSWYKVSADDKCVSVNCPAGKLCSLTDNGHQHQCVDDNGPCSPNPCKNGGTCNTNSGSFTCNCPSGYTAGDNCSTSSLQNYFLIQEYRIHSYRQRKEDRMQANGSPNTDACLYKPCTNGDICNTNATGGYTCSPPPGQTLSDTMYKY